MLHSCTLFMDIHLPANGSLKAKRTVVKHLVETARSRFAVAAAEVGRHDQWQRAELGFAAVAGSPGQVDRVLAAVERFVWSHPELEVLAAQRAWVEM